MWRSSFLVNLQACRLIASNFTDNELLHRYFKHYFKTPMLPYVLTSPHQILKHPIPNPATPDPRLWLRLLHNCFLSYKTQSSSTKQTLLKCMFSLLKFWFLLFSFIFVLYVSWLNKWPPGFLFQINELT